MAGRAEAFEVLPVEPLRPVVPEFDLVMDVGRGDDLAGCLAPFAERVGSELGQPQALPGGRIVEPLGFGVAVVAIVGATQAGRDRLGDLGADGIDSPGH